jgi:hypothetical protein
MKPLNKQDLFNYHLGGMKEQIELKNQYDKWREENEGVHNVYYPWKLPNATEFNRHRVLLNKLTLEIERELSGR